MKFDRSLWAAGVAWCLLTALVAPMSLAAPPDASVIHAPVVVSYFDEPITIEAHSACSVACVATLHWRTSGGDWQSAVMSTEPASAPSPANELRAHRHDIPGTWATTAGVDYWIEIAAGSFTDTTQTHHVTVLAPTAVLHVPVASAARDQPLPIEAVVACATSTCSASLSYRPGSTQEWTTVAMSSLDSPTAIGQATSVAKYHAVIPPESVTTRGVDYFIHADDGHTTAFSPGTAYVATAFAQQDGAGISWFHAHVAEPVRIVHAPVAVASWNAPLTINAQVLCAARDCAAALSYRVTEDLVAAATLAQYLAGGPAFTETPMGARVLQDLGDDGVLLELSATIPADAVTTEGLDYAIAVTDAQTNAFWPGTSHVSGPGVETGEGVSLAWQHVEVPLRGPIRSIVHTPVAATAIRRPIPLRFAAYCTADSPCAATVWYRTTPVAQGIDLSQVLLAEPNWLTTPVRAVSAQPATTGAVLHVFEADVPAEAVDTRGIDYVLKVADGKRAMYYPGLPYETVTGVSAVPVIAHHVHAITSPVIRHVPVPAAPTGEVVELNWEVVCSGDVAADCATKAYHRNIPEPATEFGPVDLGPVTVPLAGEPAAFSPLITSIEIARAAGDVYVLRARALIPGTAAAGTLDQYVLWAGDAHTNAYSPGTSYVGGPVMPVDGVNVGQLVPWTIRRL